MKRPMEGWLKKGEVGVSKDTLSQIISLWLRYNLAHTVHSNAQSRTAFSTLLSSIIWRIQIKKKKNMLHKTMHKGFELLWCHFSFTPAAAAAWIRLKKNIWSCLFNSINLNTCSLKATAAHTVRHLLWRRERGEKNNNSNTLIHKNNKLALRAMVMNSVSGTSADVSWVGWTDVTYAVKNV